MTFVILLIFILEKRYEIQMNDTETKNTAVKAPALMSTRPVTAQDALDQCEKLSPMMVHYCQTKTGLTDPANTILFYRLGDFYCENLEAYPDSCYLTTLCVWPDYRGQGISEVMYAEAEKDIAAKFPGSRITLRTWSTNGAQEHILDKLGYSLVRRLKDDRGEGIDTVYFVKKEENDR